MSDPSNIADHERYMKLALQEAKEAYRKEEIPVGAILVLNNQILAKAHNMVEVLQDSTAHAEILALTSAYQYLGSKYVPEATLYVTLEPCLMCAGALYWSKIGAVVYGSPDEKNGYRSCCSSNPLHPKTTIVGGVLADECAQLMKDFFKDKRGKK